MPMKSMEFDDEDKYDSEPIEYVKPDYPYGLRISLTHKELDKLGLDSSAAVVGGICHLHAMARITSVSAEESSGSSTCRIELQIEDLEIESEDAENKEK